MLIKVFGRSFPRGATNPKLSQGGTQIPAATSVMAGTYRSSLLTADYGNLAAGTYDLALEVGPTGCALSIPAKCQVVVPN